MGLMLEGVEGRAMDVSLVRLGLGGNIIVVVLPVLVVNAVGFSREVVSDDGNRDDLIQCRKLE